MKYDKILIQEKIRYFKVKVLEFIENITRSIFNLDKRFLVMFFIITMSFGLFTTILANALSLYEVYKEANTETVKLEVIKSDIARLSKENNQLKRKKGGITQNQQEESLFDFRTQEEKKAKERVQLEKIIGLFNSNSPDELKMKIVDFKDDLESNTFLVTINISSVKPVFSIVAIDYLSKYCYIDSYSNNVLIARIIQNEEVK